MTMNAPFRAAPRRRWGWPITLGVLMFTALVCAVTPVFHSPVVVYPTTDFARLPTSPTGPATDHALACASIRRGPRGPELAEQMCGSPASALRVLARVGDKTQCVGDADLSFTQSAGAGAGAVCLDYDWVAGQCLHITDDDVSKVSCAQPRAVQPEIAVIGAVDVSYCRESGIAHSIRHFTVCTLAGDKDCKRKTHDS